MSDNIQADGSPVLSHLMSASVKIWKPRKGGWVKQRYLKCTSNVDIPLTEVPFDKLRVWMIRRVRRLETLGGVLVLVHRDIGNQWVTRIGLFHDARTKLYRNEDHPLRLPNISDSPLTLQRLARLQGVLPAKVGTPESMRYVKGRLPSKKPSWYLEPDGKTHLTVCRYSAFECLNTALPLLPDDNALRIISYWSDRGYDIQNHPGVKEALQGIRFAGGNSKSTLDLGR